MAWRDREAQPAEIVVGGNLCTNGRWFGTNDDKHGGLKSLATAAAGPWIAVGGRPKRSILCVSVWQSTIVGGEMRVIK